MSSVKPQVTHVLYSGLGGHGNVFFSLMGTRYAELFSTIALFNGVEEIRSEYKNQCEILNIPAYYVKKKTWLRSELLPINFSDFKE